MKKLLLVAALAFITMSAFSQRYSESSGKTQLNVGFGFSDWGVPFYIGLDQRVAQDISVGGEFSYRSYREDWNNYYYHHNIMGFSANANYHFNTIFQLPSAWDIYAGANLGFYVWTSPDNYGGTNTSELGVGAQIGVRYFVTHKVGLNLEFGGGNAFSGGKFGLTFKL